MNETLKRVLVAAALVAFSAVVFQHYPLLALLPAAAGAAILFNVVWESLT